MALDGAFLRHIAREIQARALDARVDKIYQPNKEEIVLALKTRTQALRLLLSARPNSPRVHFTGVTIENPMQPPMLCMLLRKRLTGARLVGVEQPGLERVLFLSFDSINDLGDHVKLTLACEIMGRYSNVLLLDEDGKIIDALKRVDAEMSSERLVLPGFPYHLPPAQNKLCLLSAASTDICAAVQALPGNKKLNKALLEVAQGLSPVICRELEVRTLDGQDGSIRSMTQPQFEKLCALLDELRKTVQDACGAPYMALEVQQRTRICADGTQAVSEKTEERPMDFAFMPLTQYGSGAVVHKEESFSALLDNFYARKDGMERQRVRQQDLLRLLNTHVERLARKINIQNAELQNSEKRDTFRLYGDLLVANQYAIEKGQGRVSLQNYYDPELKQLEIPIDPALSAMQNAQKYYKDYRKAKTAQEKLTQQIQSAKEEMEYLQSVLEELSRAQTEKELGEMRQELVLAGYGKLQKSQKNAKLPALGEPLRYVTTDGFTVLVGKNNRQNDMLTLKTANNRDIWLHTKAIHGSHTILVTNGQEPTEQALYQAAVLAAMHSGASASAQVPVDYTRVRNVSKPSGAKPGMVIYVQYKTLYADPADGEKFGF